MKTLCKALPQLTLFCLISTSSAQEGIDPEWAFKGSYLLSVSDADMLASAYVDGQLGPKDGEDSLALIDLKQHPSKYSAIETFVSNSVAGPPAIMAVDKKQKIAYVIETFTPRPAGNRKYRFNHLATGTKLTSVSFEDPKNLKVLAVTRIKLKPDSIALSADGQTLAITYHPRKDGKAFPLGLYEVKEGKIVKENYPKIPQWHSTDRAIFVSWRPGQPNQIALINETKAEVSFYSLANDKLILYGNVIQVGKAPYIGRFTQDGKHFLVNNLFWGPDIQGTWNEAPNGTIVNIALEKEQTPGRPIRHAITSQVMVGASPEGFDVSPDGKFVIAANMERSWLPFDDKRQSWFSSLSLITRDPHSGAMNLTQTLPIYAILPEAVQFDASGKYFAVTVFDHYDHNIPGGSIEFFKIVQDVLNPQRTMMVQTHWSVQVARGPHTLVLVE